MAKETNQDNAQDNAQTENGNNTNAGRIGTSITPEGEMTANVLLEALGTTIEPDLLVEALTHRSFSHEHEGAKNYERLEFLGDAVLELVSTETLYKAHPDWCIHIPGRPRTTCRSQLVIDFSRKDVRDYIYGQMYKILSSANIEYVKWDMNRQLCEVGNEVLPPERQREIWHRYVLGVYEIQERLLTDFPDLLLENCAGGGSRFDAGMLYYSPQIWCSDDTDAIERLKIQYGTSMCYPCSCFGAHVSDSPNHCVGRITPFETRGRVAMVGTFGYELDITKISDDDKWNIRKQIEEFNKYNPLVRTGDHYRIGNPFDNDRFDAWEFVAKDKSEALLEYIQVLKEPSVFLHRVRLAGLEKGCYYRHEETGKVYSAEVLMNSGFDIPSLWGDFQSYIAHFIKEN